MLIDSNILIAYLNGEKIVIQKITNWKREGRILFISSISVAEALALSPITPSQLENIRSFLHDFFLSIPFDDELAQTVAWVRRKYHLKIPDAAIAATALTHSIPLVTRDTQFKKIKELTIIKI